VADAETGDPLSAPDAVTGFSRHEADMSAAAVTRVAVQMVEAPGWSVPPAATGAQLPSVALAEVSSRPVSGTLPVFLAAMVNVSV